MKKLISLLMCLMLCLCLVGVAENETTKVYVTISCGALMITEEEIELTDADGDGALTINDALILAHDDSYEGGSEEGYLAVNSDWGLSLAKLWGIENGGSYGYYVNNAMAYGLTDALNDGDRLYAFVYTDPMTWLDTYCYFDVASIENAVEGSEVTLTLYMIGWDENYNAVELPVAGATITIDGAPTDYVTGEDGSVTITLPDCYIISAVSDTLTLVPPVCLVD